MGKLRLQLKLLPSTRASPSRAYSYSQACSLVLESTRTAAPVRPASCHPAAPHARMPPHRDQFRSIMMHRSTSPSMTAVRETIPPPVNGSTSTVGSVRASHSRIWGTKPCLPTGISQRAPLRHRRDVDRREPGQREGGLNTHVSSNQFCPFSHVLKTRTTQKQARPQGDALGSLSDNYRLKSWPRLRTRPWIGLSIRPSTRSHRSPVCVQ